MIRLLFSFVFTIFFMQNIFAQQTIPLYPGEVPNSKAYATKEVWESQTNGDTLVHFISQPTLTLFLPDPAKANGTAIIICPGGGYWINSIEKEGFAVAEKLKEWGIAAFVLKYRIPNDSSMIDKSIGPLQDAQRAIEVVRSHAMEWHLDPHKIGIMGFSAGGHVASTAATHFGHSYIENPENINLRPDFAMLIYPVISFEPDIAHMGSREQLIGMHPDQSQVEFFSNEKQVTDSTPPCFLVQASDDSVVPVLNSIRFYEALHQHKISAEIHIYKAGGHGFGLTNPTTKDSWIERCKNWMQSMGWL
jgi:acetyl esterase/lipase